MDRTPDDDTPPADDDAATAGDATSASDAPTTESPVVERPVVETTDEPAPAEPVPVAEPVAAPVAERRSVDRRSLGLGAAAVLALLLAFTAGLALGDRDDDDERGGGRMERMAQGGGFPGRGGERPGGMPGGREGRDERGPGARGAHAGIGVVESASRDELTIAPLRGASESVTVELDDDTVVRAQGEDGPGDLEDAEVGDIDEGDIVAVRVDRDADDDADETVDADEVLILRAGE